jgi:hypothetical protein
MVLQSLIKERVDVRLETVDHNSTLISIAVAHNSSACEGLKGVCVALRNPELVLLRNAINDMLTNLG